MDTRGYLYTDPTPEMIKAKNLVLVEKPTHLQLKRGRVLPRERCPCGSGKMAKNCHAKHLRKLDPGIPHGNRWGGQA
jgi:hypothetical protein